MDRKGEILNEDIKMRLKLLSIRWNKQKNHSRTRRRQRWC